MAEQDINKLKSRKRALEEEVATIEKQIFNLEGAYLEDTWNHGNAVRGWEPYLTNKNKGGNAPMRRQRFKESDRIFSFSSATAEQVCSISRIDFRSFIHVLVPLTLTCVLFFQNVGEQYAIYTEKGMIQFLTSSCDAFEAIMN